MIVGLTGGIGAGKSTVCKMFKQLGVPVISADEISSEILDHDQTVFNQIAHKFGKAFLTASKTIDRHKLRKVIFQSEEDKLWLEELLHPLIKKEIAIRTKIIPYPYCIVEVPLLIEAHMQNSVDRILTIDCPVNVQAQRTIQRDRTSQAEVDAIIATQISREHRLTASDDVIENTGSLQHLQHHVQQLHKKYLGLASV